MKILATTGVSSPQMMVQDPSPTPFLPYQWILSGDEERLMDIPDEVWVRIKPQMDDFARVGLLSYRDVTTETYRDFTLYVSLAGSDTAGTGSLTAPYATVTRAMLDIPKRINHKVRVFISDGEYANAFPSDIDFEYGESGCLSIMGTGAPTIVAGPFTVADATNGLGNLEVVLTVTAAGWDAGDFRGCWVQFESGALSGKAYSVYKNTADTVTIITDYNDPNLIAEDDTFSVIKPSVKFTGMYSFGLNHNTINSTGPVGGTWAGCSFQMSNITLDASASGSHADVFNLSADSQADGPFLDFVQFETTADSASSLALYDISINWGYPKDFEAFGDAEIGITNLGSEFQMVGLQVYNPTTESKVVTTLTGDCSLMSLTIDGLFSFYSGSSYAYFLKVNSLVVGTGASFICISGEVETHANLASWAKDYCVICAGNASFEFCLLRGPLKSAIKVSASGEITVYDCPCEDVPETALRMEENTSCALSRVDSSGFLGTTGAVTWALSGDVIAAWPAAGDSITDDNGSYVVRRA